MGAVLQPVNPEHLDTQLDEDEKQQSVAVSHVERLADYSLPRALSQIVVLESETQYLQSEVQHLRDALARLEHRLMAQEQLLRNTKIREFEVRAQLAKQLP
jgi:hypothetical protein